MHVLLKITNISHTFFPNEENLALITLITWLAIQSYGTIQFLLTKNHLYVAALLSSSYHCDLDSGIAYLMQI